ncbi:MULTISPECIES: hypothetical protein [unclassified Pseudomonas]|jgi:hypothetical protein|uniref:hypothetical protein n=1 Tax=unclassified Pseudomonas TaxID=196821 RepID=UPI002168CB7C|nr:MULTISPECIES: hypothetical protein [unclassified Pseudomonas]MCS3418389.1 hypothetical protein [Pseudomonas sp. BIGb0558]MCS3437988.1 hypothetical protein [Pseudomonas sp. BIGb0450]
MSLVDRPYPVDYEHRGVKAKIDFIWGADNDPVPKGLKITFDRVDDPVIALREKAHYSSFEQARDQGIKIARADINRVLGPDPDA